MALSRGFATSGSGSEQQSSSSISGGWRDQFNQMRQAVNQAVNPVFSTDSAFDTRSLGKNFSLSGGTKGLYDNYNKVDDNNFTDKFFIGAKEAGDYWNNWLANATGNQDLAFDSSKFSSDPIGTGLRFVGSLPGMIIGGIPTGVADFGEFITGNPYHEAVKAKDSNTWYIPDYKLDMNQQAASLGNSIINIGGTFTGGAGRVIGGGGKLLSAGLGAAGKVARAEKVVEATGAANSFLSGLSKGVATRAYETAMKSKGKEIGKTGLAVGLGLDAADEGIEEFTQSYLDDFRYKTFDQDKSLGRAIESGLWGAAGGLIMGGAGRGMSYVAEKAGDKIWQMKADRLLDELGVQNENTRKAIWATPREFRSVAANRMNQVARSAYDEVLREGEMQKAHGAGLSMQIGTDGSLLFDNMSMGDELVSQIYSGSERGRQKIAYSLGTTTDILDKIFLAEKPVYNGQVYETQADALNQLTQDNGRAGKIQVALGRNPDTSYGGFYLDIDHFVHGSGHRVNPLVMAILGSDFDADKSSIYFDPRNEAPGWDGKDPEPVLNVNGYASHLLVDPETGKSLVDWLYYGLDDYTRMNTKVLEDKIRNALEPFESTVDVNQTFKSSVQDYFVNELNNIVNIEDAGERNNALSKYFIDFQNKIDEMIENGEVKDGIDANQLMKGRRTFINLLSDLTSDPETFIHSYQTIIEDEFISLIAAADGVSEDYVREAYYKDWSSEGTLGDNTKIFQMTQSLALLNYALGDEGNPIFRQYGQLLYMAKSKPSFNDIVAGMSENIGSETVLDRLIRASFRMVKAGEDPMNSIESIIQRLEFAEVMSKAAVRSQSVNSTESLDNLFDIFKEVHNSWVEKYNKWGLALTNEGWNKAYDSMYKSELGPDDDKNSAAFMRAFRNIFGNVTLSEWLDVSEFPSYVQRDGFTLNMLIDKVYRENSHTGMESVLSNVPNNMNVIKNWLHSYAKHYTDDLKRDETLLLQIFEDVGSTVHIAERMERNGGKLDPRDVPALLKFFDALHLVVGDRNAIQLRLFATDEFLNSELGQMLLRADAKGKLQIARCASLRAQFENLVNDYLHGDDSAKAAAGEILQRMSSVSVIHSMIVEDVLNGSDRMFEYVTDPEVDLDSIVTNFNAMKDFVYDDANLILDSFRTSQNPFDLQSLSKRIKQAQQAVDSFSKIVHDKLIDESNDIVATISEATNQDVVDWATQRATETLVEIDEELLWFRTYSAITGDIAYAEKARNTNAALLMFLANQYGQNGNVPSHLNLVTAHEHGHITLSDWYSNRYHVMACLMDPDYRQEVWDENQQKVVVMTRDNVWSSIYEKSADMEGLEGTGYTPGQKLNKDMMVRLFKVLPQYCGYFCDLHVGYATQNGSVAVQGDRKTSAGNDFQRWVKERNTETYKVERNLKLIKSELMNHAWFNQAIVRALGSDVLSGRISQRRGQQEVNRLANEIAAIVYYHASLVRNGGTFDIDTEDMLLSYREDVSVDIMQQIFDLTQAALIHHSNIMLGGIDETIAEDLIGKMIYGQILHDHNIEIPGIELGFDYEKSFELINQAVRHLTYTMVKGNKERYKNILERSTDLYRTQIIDEFQSRGFSYEDAANACDDLTNAAKNQFLYDFEDGIIFSDSDFSSVDALRAKLNELYADNESAISNIEGDIELVLDEDGNIDLSKKEILSDVVNRTVAEHLLKRAASANGIIVNDNAYSEYEKFFSGIQEMIKDIGKRFDFDVKEPERIRSWAEGKPTEGPRANIYSLPKMDFLDPHKQSVASRLRIQDASGGNPALVGINGGLAKKVAALSHEPSDILPVSDAIPMEPMSFYEANQLILDQNIDTDGWRVLDVDGETLRRFDSIYLSERYKDAEADPTNQEIIVFNPDDNPHGLPTANMKFTQNERQNRYHRLGGIIGRIIDFAQEAMVLKAKKKYSAPDKIVIRRSIKNAGEGDLSIDNFAIGDDEARGSISKMFHDFRNNYRRGLAEEFDPGGSMDKLGFGEDQARIISQALTPGVKVELLVLNPDTNQKETVYRVIDAKCFFGTQEQQKAAFDSRMEEILQPDDDGNVPEIVSFGVLQVSIEELSFRINRKVNEAFYKHRRYTKDIEEEAYIEALGDWSDYGEHLGGDVFTALASVTPLGYARHGQFVMPDSPTRYMGFFTDELGESPSDHVQWGKLDLAPRDDTSDGRKHKAMDEYAKSVRNRGDKAKEYDIPFLITRSWLSRKDLHDSKPNSVVSVVRNVADLDNPNVREYTGFGFISDNSEAAVRSAYKWSIGANSSLIITDEVARGSLGIYHKAISPCINPNTGKQIVDEQFGKLYLFDPTLIANKWMTDSLANPIKAYSERRPRSMIRTTVILPSGHALLGDSEMRILPNSRMFNDYFIDDGNASFPLDNFFTSTNSNVSFMKRSSVDAILPTIADFDQDNNIWVPNPQKEGWKNFRLDTRHTQSNNHVAGNFTNMQSMIVRYLSDIRSHRDERNDNNPIPFDLRSNSVVALLFNGSTYTPVISKNLPEKFDWFSIDIDPKDGVVMDWHGKTPIASFEKSGATKCPILGENWKGMTSIFFDDLPDGFDPKVGGSISIDMMGSADTESSRTPEMGDILLARTLYYTMLLDDVNGSFFYKIERNESGELTVKWNDYIQKNWSAQDKMDFLSNNPARVHRKIASGNLHVFDPDANQIADRTFREIYSNYWINNQGDPRWLFSSFRCECVPGNPDQIYIARHQGEDDSFSNYEQWELAFENADGSDLLHLFHQMQHTLEIGGNFRPICPDGKGDKSGVKYLINANGDMLVNMGKDIWQDNQDVDVQEEERLNAYVRSLGLSNVSDLTQEQMEAYQEGIQYTYLPVRFMYGAVLNESTYNTNPSIGSLISRQHQYRRGLDNGYYESEIENAMAYENFVLGDYERSQRIMDREFRKRQKREFQHDLDSDEVRQIFQYKIGSVKEVEKMTRRKKLLRDFFTKDRALYKDNTDKEKMTGNERMAAVQQELEDARRTLGLKNLTFDTMDIWIRMLTGTTPPINGKGEWEVYEHQWRMACREVVKNLTTGKKPMPAKLSSDGNSRYDGRYTVAMLSSDQVDIAWDIPYVRQSYDNNKENFINALKEEQDACEEAIEKTIPDNDPDIKKRKKKEMLWDLCAALRIEWGDTSKYETLFDDTTFGAKREYGNEFAKIMSNADQWSPEEQAVYDACVKMTDEQLAYLREGLIKKGYKAFDIGGRVGSTDAIAKTEDARLIAKICNDAADLSRIMALLNPLITFANVGDRIIHQGTMNLALHLAHVPIIGRFNPHYSKNWMNQNIVKKSVNDVLAIKLWNSYRLMEFSGTEMQFIAEAANRNMEGVLEWVEQRDQAIKQEKGLHGLIQRGADFTNKMAAGDSFQVKKQMKNFLNEFVVFAEANGQTFWFEPSDSGKTKEVGGKEVPLTVLEAMLDEPGGFGKFFTTVILARENNPSYQIAMQAMNSAKQGDMAQRTALGMVIGDICDRMPLAKFFIITCLSRFPNYNIAKTERVLNYIMPMSSIRYIFTEALSRTEYGKRIGVANAQVHAGLKQAILNDIIHLGFFNVALIMLALGQVEPPDDDDLWGNTEEWKIFGFQADAPWWLEDILGLSLPLACFWKSCDLGKPRIDILMNGIGQACYANPIMRVSDFANYLTDPFENFNESVKNDQSRFKNAEGGVPDGDEIFNTNVLSSGINWLTQFFTPSIVRDIARNDAMTKEKNYKKIKNPETGELEYTTYTDAKLRQLTRRNPVLAFLVGSIKGGDWSYFGANMPDTEYYDDYQYEKMHELSVKGLEGSERISRVNDIITILESTDDMEDLAKTGFFLDNETLSAVASQVWDNYHAWDVEYYRMQSEGLLNYYTAGNGDYDLGMKIVGQINEERNAWKQHWYNFYYDKLRSGFISGELQQYTRHNTNYAQDVYGNWYNTGRAHNLLGLATQYEDTKSNVTGEIMYDENGNPMRALIPEKTEKRDIGTLESWSANKDGNSYSKQHQAIYGDSGNTAGKANSTSNDTSGFGSGSRSYGSRGGGGGGGSRGSSGSGGSYKTPPRIYGYNSSQYPISPSRIMNSDRIQRPNNIDYLRPGFETKGSREANKRSDI